MFDNRHYVPILKGKMGEYQALQEISATDKAAFTPLIEVPPIQWNFSKDAPAKTIDAHLEPVAKHLRKAWGEEHPLFIDLLLTPDDSIIGADHMLAHVLNQCREVNVQTIPVTTLTRHADYQAATKQANATDGRGICLRLKMDDFERGTIDTEINDLLTEQEVTKEQVDLIVDIESIPDSRPSVYLMAIKGMIGSLPDMNDWRTLTLASSAFPANLTDFDRDIISQTSRTDWFLWNTLAQNPGSLRVPTFGDYGISHPITPELDPRIMQASASIRYTSEEYWLVVKGRGVRMSGFEQFRLLSDKLINRNEYSGEGFSWGDGFIKKCADRTEGTGNLTTWRKVGTNHHIKYVIDQLSRLP